jgi:hypothetical protein
MLGGLPSKFPPSKPSPCCSEHQGSVEGGNRVAEPGQPRTRLGSALTCALPDGLLANPSERTHFLNLEIVGGSHRTRIAVSPIPFRAGGKKGLEAVRRLF